ncbi:MAG: enoyl-CoA hydratase/isomerase family protein [Acidimicrobiales bacterium]
MPDNDHDPGAHDTADHDRPPPLLVEHRDGVDWLTLNSPDRLNAVSRAMREALHDYLDAVERRDDVRVIVLRGAGRGFCAGLDLKDRPAASEAPVQGAGYKMLSDQRRWSQLVVKLRRIPQPVVALVHGSAAGLGMSLALAADIRIAGESARFNAAFIRIGFGGGDCGSSYLLPRLVGSSVARELLMTGRFCDAERALRVGLVSEVVADDELTAAGEALVADLLYTAPTGLRLTKDLLNASESGMSLEEVVAMEDRNQSYCSLTGDPAEGMRAFLEKRPPEYR